MEEKDKFANIRSEDRSNLEKTLEVLQKRDLDVYLTGSASVRNDYVDIDLLVSGNGEKETLLDRLNQAVDELKKTGATVLLPRLDIPTYMGSFVDARYQLEFNGTKFDIAYSQRPFELVSKSFLDSSKN